MQKILVKDVELMISLDQGLFRCKLKRPQFCYGDGIFEPPDEQQKRLNGARSHVLILELWTKLEFLLSKRKWYDVAGTLLVLEGHSDSRSARNGVQLFFENLVEEVCSHNVQHSVISFKRLCSVEDRDDDNSSSGGMFKIFLCNIFKKIRLLERHCFTSVVTSQFAFIARSNCDTFSMNSIAIVYASSLLII